MATKHLPVATQEEVKTTSQNSSLFTTLPDGPAGDDMKEGDVAYASPTILGYPCRYTPVSSPQNPYTSGGSVSFPHGSSPMFPTATRARVPSLTSIPCLPEPRAPSPNFAL